MPHELVLIWEFEGSKVRSNKTNDIDGQTELHGFNSEIIVIKTLFVLGGIPEKTENYLWLGNLPERFIIEMRCIFRECC